MLLTAQPDTQPLAGMNDASPRSSGLFITVTGLELRLPMVFAALKSC